MVLRQAMIAAAVLLALPSLASAAPKHRHHHRHVVAAQAEIVCDRQGCRASHENAHGRRSVARYESNSRGSDPRPAAWCGYWMRHHVSADPGRAFNLAIKWREWGRAIAGPIAGAIDVERHHVFKVISVLDRGRVLAISGNDGGRVRTRVRQIGR